MCAMQGWRADGVDDNDPKLGRGLGSTSILDYLLDLADWPKISTKDVCVLCWYQSWDIFVHQTM